MTENNFALSRPDMSDKVFGQFRDIVYQRSGIHLGPAKKSLVCARVAKRLRGLGLDSYTDYLKYLSKDESGEEIVQLLDVISTNVTSFFREPDHFRVLGENFREWLSKGQTRFRFWSSACSSGEEPYTMAVALLDVLQDMGIPAGRINIRILATDISVSILQKCRVGTYRADRMKGLKEAHIRKYFTKKNGLNGIEYSVKPELKSMVLVKSLNLSQPPFPMNGPMDAVFCRNVMIYFDNTVRKNLLSDIYRLLKPEGLLFVGHAESLAGMMMKQFKNVRPAVYRK